MSDPAAAVQKAYYERLVASIAAVSGRVYDFVPASPSFPYLNIGEIQTIDDGAGCIDATEVFVTLHVWSRAVGNVEARTIAGACRAALHEWLPDLSAAQFSCVDHLHRDSRVFRDPDGLTAHGVLTFRLLVDRI